MVMKIFLVFFLCVSVYGTLEKRQDFFQRATRKLNEYLSTREEPSILRYALKNFPLSYIFKTYADPEPSDNEVDCILCQIVVEILIQHRRSGMTVVQLSAEASYFCTMLNIEDQRVCDGIIKPNAEIFAYMVDNSELIDGQRVCSLLMQTSHCNKGDNYEWTIDIPEGQTVDKPKASGSNVFNILHVSDVHYDPLYTPGKSSQCGEPLCCQADQVDGTDETNTCGYWSDYTHADMPLHAVYECLKQAATHDFDYVYYTGDTVRHRVWSTSVESNTDAIVTITDAFRQYFKVPVYPVLGNHEPHPVNVWSGGVTDKALSSQWLFDLVAEQWSDSLTEDAKQTILKGGYYTVSPKKGFRIIALNTNVCYTENWWLINGDKDPYGQLAWLVEVLTNAEKNGESVHILYHMPTGGGSCLQVWSREYGKIVERFAHTITGQFYGHTHKDEFTIFYNSSQEVQAINVAWSGGSIISDNANPDYKLYQIDADTFDVLDYEEWTFNLTRANLYPDEAVPWHKLYSFKDAYGLNSLEPAQMDRLVNRMTQDHTLIQQYYYYKYRASDVAINNGCDASCQKDLLCDITTTIYGVTDQCERLKVLYDENT